MGEAMYFIGAEFGTAKAALDAKERLAELLEQVSEAEDFWQENRTIEPAVFWPEFENRFGMVYDELFGGVVDRSDCNNSLAGCMSYTDETGDMSHRVDVVGKRLYYEAYVWHYANWDDLVGWLKVEGARRVVWFSDEDFNFRDAVDAALGASDGG